jgi:trigger factor
MVPVGMVRKMYGASIFYDEVIRTVEKELNQYLTEEKPTIFGQPLPMENDLKSMDMNNPQDYEFPFEMGLKPEISLDALKSTDLVLHKIKVTPEMINEEIENLISKNGTLKDEEAVNSPDNVLNVLFEECDAEGNVIEGATQKDNSILVKYFSEEYQQKLQDKKVGDSLVLQLNTAFPEKERGWISSDLGLDKEDETAGDRYFKMSITKIGMIEKKELNEEFFNLVFPGKDIKTEEEFRKILTEEMQKQWDAASRNQLHDQLYHKLLETPLEMPEAFLKRWLQIGGEKTKTKEEAEEEYPTFVNQLKWTLISDKIIVENSLDVSEVELRDAFKQQVMGYFGQMNMPESENDWIDSYIDRMMKDEKQVDGQYRKMITEKLFQWLETQVTPAEKEITPEEFSALQHHHEH